MDMSITPQEIVKWLSKEIEPDKLVFDDVVYIHERITTMLAENNLEIKVNNKLFILKLALYLYKNTYQ